MPAHTSFSRHVELKISSGRAFDFFPAHDDEVALRLRKSIRKK
jgi:hypothetical protein